MVRCTRLFWNAPAITPTTSILTRRHRIWTTLLHRITKSKKWRRRAIAGKMTTAAERESVFELHCVNTVFTRASFGVSVCVSRTFVCLYEVQLRSIWYHTHHVDPIGTNVGFGRFRCTYARKHAPQKYLLFLYSPLTNVFVCQTPSPQTKRLRVT